MEVCAPKSKIFKTYITSSAILYGDGDALISIFIAVHKLPFYSMHSQMQPKKMGRMHEVN